MLDIIILRLIVGYQKDPINPIFNRPLAVVGESDEITNQAKNILRLEISPSIADIKKFSSNKKAVELLIREFFEHITKLILEGITFHNIENEI